MAEPLNAVQKELVQKNLDLAHFLSQEAWRRNRNELEIEEVVSVAYQGLIRAALRFDPALMSAETVENGKAFAGFARQKINGAILDWQREIDHVQRSYRQWYKQLQKLGYVTNETPRAQLQDYAAQMDLDLDKLVLIIRAVENRNVSLDLDHSGTGPLEDVVTGASFFGDALSQQLLPSVESSAEGNQITRALQDAFNRLTDTQRAVIVLRYYAQEEFQAMAVELDMSLTSVRNTHSDALDLLHSAMSRAATEHV